jgi:hypothetical protein
MATTTRAGRILLLLLAVLAAAHPTWAFDFNNDGKADILWRHSTGAMHQWLMSASSVGSSAWLGTVTSGWAIAGVGDYNGDGKADIVWRHTSGDVSLWLLDGPSIIGTGLPGGVATSWRIQ